MIQNLVINADQSMPSGGTVRISARNMVAVQATLPSLPQGAYVRVEVADDGMGIQAAVRTRIFEPYLTTKEEGVGLGLATAYAIVQNHNGVISVDSQEGEGTVFTIYLPARQEELGYQCLTASDGEEAVAAYRRAIEQGEPFDAVILDLTIPGGMGGVDTLNELQRLDPGVAAIVSSGYSGRSGPRQPQGLRVLRDGAQALQRRRYGRHAGRGDPRSPSDQMPE